MATRKLHITKTIVDQLLTGDTAWDTELSGFGIRCQKKAKVYVVKKFYDCKQHWFSIGKPSEGMTVATARKKAEIILGQIADGKDPAFIREAKKNRPNMKELCERFLSDYAKEHKKPSSIYMDESNIRNHILPLLGKKFVADVTLTDIDQFKRAIKDGKTSRPMPDNGKGGKAITGGTGAANRCLALLSKAFNLSIQWGWRETNPVQHVQKYKEKKIERFLSEYEFMKLAEAINTAKQRDEANPYAIAAIRLLIFTGARRSEILTLRWDAVNFELNQILLADSKTGAKQIFLNPPALELLSNLPRQKNNPYVICGLKEASHLFDVNRTWKHIREFATLSIWLEQEDVQEHIKANNHTPENTTFKQVKLLTRKEKIELPKGLLDLRLHDLRHSFASIAVGGGMSLPMIGKLLGHTQTATTARYAHLADNPLKEANDAIGRRLQGLMEQHRGVTLVKLENKNEI
ncbi:MAG: tyrosine-type recombinase/integrase [Emcibacter sp.]|nr:tyrosine-type recombinase/integrase [Emcibacter sp.]